ncbi:hypothetical protein [Pedobacter gandavensis]|uniref:hypothetical protein n=1 Tax=Pedobacter gandavensis TaxID=2679963 RepID=UPI00292E0B65|nr:hypothetical protein [Pedobacter gandavensis]
MSNRWQNNWFPLPGEAVFDRDKQHVSAVSRAPGNLDLFVIGFENHVWTTFWNDQVGWNPDWFPLPGQVVFDWDKQHVSAVSRSWDKEPRVWSNRGMSGSRPKSRTWPGRSSA